VFLRYMRYLFFIIFIMSAHVFSSCRQNTTHVTVFEHALHEVQNYTELRSVQQKEHYYSQYTLFELQLLLHDFVNVADIDSTIIIDLRYTTSNNNWKQPLLANITHAMLQKDVAQKLHTAQKISKSIDSSYSLILYDAVRPHSVQKMMWDVSTLPLTRKRNFIAHPTHTSLHNYGAAVDVSLCKQRIPLDMGTPFDFAGKAAYTYIDEKLLRSGELTATHIANRKLLQRIMILAGFIPNKYEWWHFNACYRYEVAQRYPFVVSYDSIAPPSRD